MSILNNEHLLSEKLADIEDAIRAMPDPAAILDHTPENDAWFGRACAAIENWDSTQSFHLSLFLLQIASSIPNARNEGLRRFRMLLHQARHALLAQLPRAGTAVVQHGMVFDYFDGIRKIIALGTRDLLFVDPYLDADFVSRYLPNVAAGVTIRLLAREKLATLLPAVDEFGKQSSSKVEVRSAPGFHDRYLIVDGTACYQSGASFKDGAKTAPTTVTQIIDAFDAVARTYEHLWHTAKVER